MAGLTITGLVIKTQDDVVTDLQTQATSIFSDQILPGDTVDVSGNSALGRIIGVIAPSLADVWEAIQQVNDSFNPNSATGISLDNMVALSGISRYAATPTRAQVLLTGDINTVISSPLGMAYSSITQRTFSIVNPITLSLTSASGVGIAVVSAIDATVYTVSYSTDGVNYIDTSITSATGSTTTSILAQLNTALTSALSATFTTSYDSSGRLWLSRIDPFQTVSFSTTTNLRVEKVAMPGLVQDDTAGPYAALESYIDTISVPITGWDSITNPIAAVTGRLVETDVELRERFRNSKFIESANIIEALIDALESVDGVTDVNVLENDTDTTDSNGVTPHSFMPIVLGGLPTDIGAAIWANKPTGIGSIGDTTVQVPDSQGYIHNISFKRPTSVPIYMYLDISSTGTLAGDAVATIKQNLLTYGQTNYLTGDDVVYSRFYTPINAVSGHQVNHFYIGTSANPTATANIPITFEQVATFDVDNMNVIITTST